MFFITNIRRIICALLCLGLCHCQTVSSQKNVYLDTAHQYAKEGLLREAIDAYKKALKLEPKNPSAQQGLGLTLLQARDYKRSIPHLLNALAATSAQNAFALTFALGEAYRGCDNYTRAIFYYQSALQQKPADSDTLKPLAWSYYNNNLLPEALDTALLALKNRTDDPELYLIATHILLKMRRNNEAQNYVEAGLKIANQESKPYLRSLLAQLQFIRGDYDGAFAGFSEAIKTKPFMTHALVGLGRYYLKFSREKDAIPYLEQAVRIKPRDPEPVLLLATAYEPIDRKKSARVYKYFVTHFAANPEYSQRIEALQDKIATLSTEKSEP